MDDSPAATNASLPVDRVGEQDFVALYRANFSFVWRSLRRLGVDGPSLDDAAQEVFLTAHRRLPDFEGRSSVKTWLFGILLNTARHHRRAMARRPAHEPLGEAVPDARRPGPHEAAVRAQAVAVLHGFLEGLDDDLRAVFVMSELEQLTAPEVAAATGVNVNTVSSRIRAVRSQFEQMVARRRAGDPWSRP